VTTGALVVGYGNALRTDDGVGWHAAELLAEDPRLDGATVLARHQLTPELALDFSRATFVVLVDASHGPPPGTFTIERMERAGHTGTTWSHHIDPASLVALGLELYSRAPDVYLVRVGAASLEMGKQLSPLIEAVLPKVVDAVAELVVSRVAARGAEAHACGSHA
jgi:hydrogenase maturation protease